jgi:hypothetical protein
MSLLNLSKQKESLDTKTSTFFIFSIDLLVEQLMFEIPIKPNTLNLLIIDNKAVYIIL